MRKIISCKIFSVHSSDCLPLTFLKNAPSRFLNKATPNNLNLNFNQNRGLSELMRSPSFAVVNLIVFIRQSFRFITFRSLKTQTHPQLAFVLSESKGVCADETAWGKKKERKKGLLSFFCNPSSWGEACNWNDAGCKHNEEERNSQRERETRATSFCEEIADGCWGDLSPASLSISFTSFLGLSPLLSFLFLTHLSLTPFSFTSYLLPLLSHRLLSLFSRLLFCCLSPASLSLPHTSFFARCLSPPFLSLHSLLMSVTSSLSLSLISSVSPLLSFTVSLLSHTHSSCLILPSLHSLSTPSFSHSLMPFSHSPLTPSLSLSHFSVILPPLSSHTPLPSVPTLPWPLPSFSHFLAPFLAPSPFLPRSDFLQSALLPHLICIVFWGLIHQALGRHVVPLKWQQSILITGHGDLERSPSNFY